tara:strand:+ start:923 stop:2170 length:1248 start_codon:yes stop_codon:yes gene_type:complete
MGLIQKLFINLTKNLTINKAKYIFLIFSFSPLLFVLLLIRPFVLLRFGSLGVQRIGAISLYEQYLLINKDNKTKKNLIDLWVINKPICNKQLLTIYKRHFLIINRLFAFYKILIIISKYIPIYSKHIIIVPDTYYAKTLFNKYSSQLRLTRKEIEMGETKLADFGIPHNAKIICITSRDQSYLKKKYPSKSFLYHNYRNISAKNYTSTIKTLIKKKFYVIRMGKIADKKINIKNDKFIDYPFHPSKNDFMDFFFAHRCYFWVCSNNGLDEIAKVFRKPLIDSNMAQLVGLKTTYKKALLCLKIYKNSKNKKMSLSKIFDSGAGNSASTNEFKRKKIKLKELTQSQLKDLVLEMLILMKNAWEIKTTKDIKLQKKFEELFLNKIKNIDTHDASSYKKVNAVYSAAFLKKNPWFLRK